MCPLSDSDRSELVGRASSLHERLAAAPRDGAGGREPSASTRRLLEEWAWACACSNQAAFRRRLGWDDLDEKSAADRIEGFEAGPEHGAWVGWLERFGQKARTVARQLEQTPGSLSSAHTNVPDQLPLRELWIPFTEVARDSLAAEATAPLRSVSAEAVGALVEGLAREIAHAAELACYEAFCSFRDAAPGDDTYPRFVSRSLDSGLADLFRAYPVLARDLARLVERWIGTTRTLFERIERDRRLLAEDLGGGNAPGRVTCVTPDLSDRHDGGFTVARIGFESGLTVIYKPRGVALEQGFHDFVQWCRRRGMPSCPPSLRILDRGEYGWEQCAEPAGVASRAEMQAYYRRAGALICLTYLLGAEDLHMENIVATAEGPVVIDGECLLQPEMREDVAREYGLGRAGVEDSCIGTGLLSLIEQDATGAVRDVGGLRGEGGFPVGSRSPVWEGLGTSELRLGEKADSLPEAQNRPRLDGEPQAPERHAAEIRRGFDDAYGFLREHRDLLTAPESPLRPFDRCRTRIVLRNTQSYARTLARFREPEELRDGVRRGLVIEALHRGQAGAAQRPTLWPLARVEHEILTGLDVPRFTMGTRSTELPAGLGPTLGEVFTRSGLDVARDRLMRMGVDDLSRQQRRLDDGLAGFVGARLGSFPTPEAPGALRRTAELLGEELLARAQPQAEGSLRWRFPDHDRQPRRHRTPLGLYDGLSGVAVFLAGLAAATGDERWSSAAEGTLRTLEAELAERRSAPPDAAEAGPGPGLDGIGSLIYAGALVSRLTGSPRASGLVAAAAECFAADSTPESPGDDVAQGLAGLILFLLAAHEVGAPAGPLDAARRLGDELAGRAGTVPAALGLAHGGSGIGLALARLHGVTGETVHRTAAVRCFDVERAAVERWMREPGPPAARAVSRPWSISSWCNGPPGMALARALALEHLEEPAIRRDLDLALEAVLQPLERRSDHLCCGNLGVVEVLWTLGRRCQRPEALARADEILAGVLDRAKRRGHFVLSASPFEHRIFDPGFFRGLSGIGYLLLRMSELADLPSVLAFETRCPARSTPQPHPEEV